MIYFIELSIYLIFLFNKSDGINEDILVINEPSHYYQPSYTIISTNNRIKRDQSSNIHHDIDQNPSLCEHNIYSQLSNCLYVSKPM